MSKVKVLVFATLAVALSVSTASANNYTDQCTSDQPPSYCFVTVTLTFYGTVTSGTDDLGLFGPSGTPFGTTGPDLTGKSAVLSLSTDRLDAAYATEIGGIDTDVSGAITIGGHSQGLYPADGGSFQLSGSSAEAFTQSFSSELAPNLYGLRGDASVTSINSFVPPQDLPTFNGAPADYLGRSFSYNLQPGDSGDASVHFEEDFSDVYTEPGGSNPCPTAFWNTFRSEACAGGDNIGVSINRVTFDSGAPAVPEPATWMMVLLALSGVMLVRRHQQI